MSTIFFSEIFLVTFFAMRLQVYKQYNRVLPMIYSGSLFSKVFCRIYAQHLFLFLKHHSSTVKQTSQYDQYYHQHNTQLFNESAIAFKIIEHYVKTRRSAENHSLIHSFTILISSSERSIFDKASSNRGSSLRFSNIS